MLIRTRHKIAAWILSICMVITLIPEIGFAATTADKKTSKETQEQKIKPEDVTKEDVVEKTTDTTTYDLGKGEQMTVFHGGEVRYENEKGKLVDYDPSLVAIKEGETTQQDETLDGYAYENKRGDKKHYLPESLSEDTPIIMENGDYSVEFSMTDETLARIGADKETVQVESETMPTTYESEEEKPVNAVYGESERTPILTYTSGEHGVKETLTLEERPASNVFQYWLKLKGMTARKNVTDGGITYYDKETGEITGHIDAPWMNDASQKAYSEDIVYDLKEEAGQEGRYLLTMTVDEAYLDDEQRQYPITIDPTSTWQGSTKVKDAYVISGSKYSKTNFYESGTKVMPVGKNSTGWHRTLMRYGDLTGNIKGKTITSAKLTVYETGTGAAKQKIGIHRLKADWNPNTVTWSNMPSYQAAYGTITTKRTDKSAHTFNVISYIQALAGGSVSGYGLMLKSADVDNAGYACFYGSRTAASAYRPKLVITHYTKPTTATSASISPAHVKASTAAKISYGGISSTGLNRVEYRVDRVTCGTTRAAHWAYASSRTIANGAALPSLPEGCYEFYVRGVNTGGTAGGERSAGIVHADSTAPVISISGPSTSAAAPSGNKTPTISWSISDRHLKSVSKSVDGGSYTPASASGSGAQTFSSTGAHTFTIQAQDQTGNTATKTYTYYLDKTVPTMGAVSLQADGRVLGTNWTQEGNPLISFSGVTDNMAIKSTGIQYAITKKGTPPTESDYKAISFATISAAAPYTGTFRLTAADQKLGTGSYSIHLRAKDVAGNSTVKELTYNKDITNPTAKLSVTEHSGGPAITTAKDVVTVGADLDGTGSPIKKATVALYQVIKETDDSGTITQREQFVENLIANVTKSTTYEWNTRECANGIYRLKAEVEDSVGLKGQAVYVIKIANPAAAPVIKADPTKTNPLSVEWRFPTAMKELQYQIKGQNEWISVPDSAKASGRFDIQLPSEGKYDIHFRGVDTADVPTQTCAVTCVYDATAPEAKISGFTRGRVKGTAKDAHLKKWSLLCKKEGDPESAYEEKLSGAANVENGELGILDLSDPWFQTGRSYDLKLVVTDMAGNQSEATREFYNPANESNIQVMEPKFRIQRPSWYTDYESGSFTIGRSQKTMTLKNAEEGCAYTWFIDNRKAGEGTSLEKDFSVYADDKEHRVLVIGKDEKGARTYSRNLIENDKIKTISFGEGAARNKEQTMTAEKDIVSFRLSGGQETETGQQVRYFAKAGDGDYVEIQQGKTCHVTQLAPGTAYAREITVKAEHETEVAFEDVKLELDTIGEETFSVDALSDYMPETASVKPKLNDRAYVYWENAIPESDTTTSYNVYHSPDKDFVPSPENLAAENVRAGYYSEINVNYGKDFYYRITVVKRDSQGNILSESEPSRVFGGKILDYDEHTKRLGLQDYWQYEDFNTPVGSGSIEKSRGNFVYQQTDASLPNEKLEVDLVRTYNSGSSEKSAFGLGWNHNYDMQLLDVYDKQEGSFDNIVFKDGTGTINRFIKSGDGDTYISSQGEYVTLEKETKVEDVQIQDRKSGTSSENPTRTAQVASQYTVRTKDNMEYRFNGGGQLVYTTEPNSSFMLFEYDDTLGLLKKVTTNKGISVDFVYDTENLEGDMLLVKEIKLPDGVKRQYAYKTTDAGTNRLLTSVTATDKNGKTIVYEYGYDNADNPNVDEIKDAEGNVYNLKYEDEQVAEATYPNKEGVAFTYDKSGVSTTTTWFKSKGLLTGMDEIASATDHFEKNTGYCVKSVDANGKATEYEYVDGVCVSSSWKMDSQYIAEDGAILSKGETAKKELTELGARRNETEQVNEDGSVAVYEYHADTSNVNIQDLVKHQVVTDADDDITEEDYYEYDEWGNEIEDYDVFDDLTTISEYDEEGELTSEIEYKGKEEENQVVRTTEHSYAYDEQGGKTETVIETSGDKKTETTTVFDMMGNEVSSVIKSGAAGAALGATSVDSSVTTVYDGFGRAVKTTSKEGNVTTMTENVYDDNGTLTKETVTTSGNGQTSVVSTYYTYDSNNRLTAKTVNDNGETQTWTTTYGREDVTVRTATGQGRKQVKNAAVTTETDGDGRITAQTVQDNAGNTVREKAKGLYTETLYDDYGTAVGTYEAGTDPDSEEGLLTLNVYNEKGHQTDTVMKPERRGSAWYVGDSSIRHSKEYSEAGKETAAVDAMGNRTTYGYDAKGQLNQVTLPDGGKTSYQTRDVYVNGKLETRATTTDAVGNVSKVTANEAGQEVEIKDFYEKDGEDWSIHSDYEYDAKGRLSRKSEAKGNYQTYVYDANDRVAETRHYEKSGKQTLETTYSYDLAGNVTKMCDYDMTGDGRTLLRTTVYGYDKQNRLISFAECDGPQLPTQADIDGRKVTYAYDKDGNMTDVDYAFARDGVTGLTYHYNGDKWLTKITAKGGLMGKTLREHRYDAFGRIAETEDHYGFAKGGSGSMIRAYEYDDFGRVTKMTHTDSKDGEAKESYGYKYDKNGNIVEERIVSHYRMDDGKGLDLTRSYSYDVNGKLLAANVTDHAVDGTRNQSVAYTYDKVGNRLTETEGELLTTYAYNGLNQLTGSESQKTSAANAAEIVSQKTYEYDRNGNQTKETDSVTGESRTMAYDEANRLRTFTAKKGGTVQITQENRYNGNGQRIRKQEMKDAVTATTDYYYQGGAVLRTTDGNGKQTSLNLSGVENNVIATARGTGDSADWYLYNKDVRESVSSLVDGDGNLAAAYLYDPFGNTETLANENFENEIRYTGQIYDESAGLYYYNARYYDPEDGRFLSQDTYRGENMEPETLHLYGYCANNPVNYVDPSGHARKKRIDTRPKTGTKIWSCFKATKKILREKIAPYYKNKPTMTLLKEWAKSQYLSEFFSLGAQNSSWKTINKFTKKFFKQIGPYSFVKSAFDLGNCFWKGSQHKIWQQIDTFYKKHLIGKKAKENKLVYFCSRLSYKRKGSNGGAFLPTGEIELHLKKHTHK